MKIAPDRVKVFLSKKKCLFTILANTTQVKQLLGLLQIVSTVWFFVVVVV